MNDNNDNIVEFPTQDRKNEVMKDRTHKSNNFSSPFPSYNLTSFTFSSGGFDKFEKWVPPSFDDDTISFSAFENVKWTPSFGPTDTNLLNSIIDRCATIQRNCINAASRQDTITLQHVLDKLDEAVLLSKISSK